MQGRGVEGGDEDSSYAMVVDVLRRARRDVGLGRLWPIRGGDVMDVVQSYPLP